MTHLKEEISKLNQYDFQTQILQIKNDIAVLSDDFKQQLDSLNSSKNKTSLDSARVRDIIDNNNKQHINNITNKLKGYDDKFIKLNEYFISNNNNITDLNQRLKTFQEIIIVLKDSTDLLKGQIEDIQNNCYTSNRNNFVFPSDSCSLKFNTIEVLNSKDSKQNIDTNRNNNINIINNTFGFCSGLLSTRSYTNFNCSLPLPIGELRLFQRGLYDDTIENNTKSQREKIWTEKLELDLDEPNGNSRILTSHSNLIRMNKEKKINKRKIELNYNYDCFNFTMDLNEEERIIFSNYIKKFIIPTKDNESIIEIEMEYKNNPSDQEESEFNYAISSREEYVSNVCDIETLE